MKARLAIVGLALVIAGCTGPAEVPSTSPPTPAAPEVTPKTSPAATAATPTPRAPRTPVDGHPDLILSGTAIGDRPLGATPQSVLDPDLVARLGKPKIGRTQLCQLTGDRTRFAVVDHVWSGLIIHYGRRGAATIAIGWQVALDRVPDGVRLADRLPWRPTFAALAASNGVEVQSSAGVKTARLSGRAISYTGDIAASRPDRVTGGPELTCR